MKNQLRVSSVWNFTLLFTFLLSVLTCTELRGQYFVPSSSVTNYFSPYPTGVNPNWALQWRPSHAASYKAARIGVSRYDLYISAWIDASNNARIVWRVSDAGNPSTITTTGGDMEFTLDSTLNINDIAVGIIETATGYQALVAYNDIGNTSTSGVVLRSYDVSSTTLQLDQTTMIKTVLYQSNYHYTRVDMDSWRSFASVVWKEIDPNSPHYVIKCLPIDAGVFGTQVFLNNTLNGTNASTGIYFDDYALNDFAIHIVYYDPPHNDLVEIRTRWDSIWNASFSTYVITPVVEDINSLSSVPVITPKPYLDCPINNVSGYENWAYCYAINNVGNDIYLRLVDGASSPSPLTQNLTNGSLGNIALSGRDNERHTISYGSSGDNIYIGWRTNNSITSSKNYICVQVSSDGSTLLSASDYLLVNSANYIVNGLVFCKNNAGPCLYAISSYEDFSGFNVISHQFHGWTATTSTFKGNAKNSLVNYNVSSCPNPFSNFLSLDVSSALMNETVKVSLTDVLGRIIMRKEIQGRDLNDMVNSCLSNMSPGSYWLNVSKPSFKYSQVLSLVKTGSK